MILIKQISTWSLGLYVRVSSCQTLPAIAERLLSTFTGDKLALPKCPENAFSGMSISHFFQGNMPPNPPKRIGPSDSLPSTLTKPRPTWKLK